MPPLPAYTATATAEMDESANVFDPGTPYAMTKLLGEHYTRFFTSFHGLSTVSLRYFNCYGPKERPGRYRNVIPNFLYTALLGNPLVVTGNGDETRDFCYVADIVNGTLLAAEHDEISGAEFNLAAGRPVSILELAEQVNRLTGNDAGITLAGRRAWDHVTHRQPAIRKAQTLLEYKAETPLEKGLERTLAWMREHWEKIRRQTDLTP